MKIIHLLILFSLCTLAACAAPAIDVAERAISVTPTFTVAPTVTASLTPQPTAIPGLAVDGGVAEWQAPSLDLAAVQEMDQAQDENLLAVAEAVLGEAMEMGLPFAQTSVIQFGEEDNFRAAVESKAVNGNILWGFQHDGDTFRLTEQPVVLEWRDGAFHLVEMEYYEIPNSAEAVILGGQGSDGTLWTVFREPVTLADGSQVYALYYDMQVVREEKGKLVPGDWKFVPGVGIDKWGIIDGQAQRIDDQFNLEDLGFAADELIRDGDNLMFQLGGMPVAVVDAQGKVTNLTIEKAVFPDGIDPVVEIERYTGPVEKDQGKILGLNEFGWAVTEFKDGDWVPFERRVVITGEYDDMTYPYMPAETLKQLEASEITPPPFIERLFSETELWMGVGGKPDFYGTLLPTDKDKRILIGYLGSNKIFGGDFYGGLVLGSVEYESKGFDARFLVIEVPYKTERQIIMYCVPRQSNYHNELWLYSQEGKDLVIEKTPIEFDALADMVARQERGRWVLFEIGTTSNGAEYQRNVKVLLQYLREGLAHDDPKPIGLTVEGFWLPK